MRFLLLLLFFTSILTRSDAQHTIVTGKITDKTTGLHLTHINVKFEDMPGGTLSDHQGKYHIQTKTKVSRIRFSGIGYHAVTKNITAGEAQEMNIALEPHTQDLSEVSVSVTKTPSYRNKNNPAVELIRKVIAHKAENLAQNNNNIAFEQYEKLSMALSLPNQKAKKSKILKKFPFLLKNSDSLKQSGKTLIPLFIQEKLSQHKYSSNPEKKEVVNLGEKQSRIDQYFDEDGITEYLDKIYQKIDLYDHDIGMGNQRFLSPISEMGPQFYKYFILDTLKDVSPWQVKMMIAPKNKQDVLFLGYLYISLDNHYALQKANLSINNQINLNWVKDLQISLEYQKDSIGRYHLAKSVMGMDFGLFKEGGSLFGERTLMANNFVTGAAALQQPLKGSTNPESPAPVLPDTFWEQARHERLSSNERMAYANIDSLKNSRTFKRAMGFAALIISGYRDLGPVEIGPFNSFYSFNPVEGSRFKFGGRTTDAFSKRLYFDGHVAYGTKDHRWKYSLGTTLSLTERSIYQFPVHSLTLRHSFETQIPGQDLNFLEDDNFLLSFKRGRNDKWLYNRKWLLEYLHETPQHLSFRLAYKNQVLQAAGKLHFIQEDPIGDIRVPQLTTSEFSTEIRWAPHEKFYQGKRFRRPIKNGYPVFTLRGVIGLKGFLNGDYNYQSLTFNASKRIFMSQFGYSDVIIEGGAIFGKVPYPLLAIHRANQTYAYQLPSYNLMNFMEFMSDRYASLNLEHSFNGFFLNKVPLVKRLQLREVASLKILTGDISAKNRPDENSGLYRFPTDERGRVRSFALDRTPYIEGSIGLSNIFKVLRVDYVRRFTYLNNPGVAKWGIRVKLNVDF